MSLHVDFRDKHHLEVSWRASNLGEVRVYKGLKALILGLFGVATRRLVLAGGKRQWVWVDREDYRACIRKASALVRKTLSPPLSGLVEPAPFPFAEPPAQTVEQFFHTEKFFDDRVRLLAHVLGDKVIQGTDLEGMSFSFAVRSWIDSLTTLPVARYSEEERSEIEKAIHALRVAHAMQMANSLTLKGVAALPDGGFLTIPVLIKGHAIFVEIQKEITGLYSITVINVGIGTEKHHAGIEGFFSHKGVSPYLHFSGVSLEKLKRCLVNRGSIDSFYESLFSLFSGCAVDNRPRDSEMVTAQRSGTCTWSTPAAWLRLKLGTTLYKRVMLDVKMGMLFQSYVAVKEDLKVGSMKARQLRSLLEKSAEIFLRRLDKAEAAVEAAPQVIASYRNKTREIHRELVLLRERMGAMYNAAYVEEPLELTPSDDPDWEAQREHPPLAGIGTNYRQMRNVHTGERKIIVPLCPREKMKGPVRQSPKTPPSTIEIFLDSADNPVPPSAYVHYLTGDYEKLLTSVLSEKDKEILSFIALLPIEIDSSPIAVACAARAILTGKKFFMSHNEMLEVLAQHIQHRRGRWSRPLLTRKEEEQIIDIFWSLYYKTERHNSTVESAADYLSY